MEVFGINDKLFGLKVGVYTPDVSTERGVFFAVDAVDWVAVPRRTATTTATATDEKKKASSKKYNEEFTMIKNYSINDFMHQGGWDALLAAGIELVESPHLHITRKLLKSSNQFTFLDRLDNVLNLEREITID